LSENASFEEYEKKMVENTKDERGVYYFFEIMFTGSCPKPGEYVPKPTPKYEYDDDNENENDSGSSSFSYSEGAEIDSEKTDEPEDIKSDL